MLRYLSKWWKWLAGVLGGVAALLLLRRASRPEQDDESLIDLAPYPPPEPWRGRQREHVHRGIDRAEASKRLKEQADAAEQSARDLSEDELSEAMAKDMKRVTGRGGLVFLLFALAGSAEAQERMPEVNHPITGERGWWVPIPYAHHLYAIKSGDEKRRESLRQCEASVADLLNAQVNWEGERLSYQTREVAFRTDLARAKQEAKRLRTQVAGFARWRGWRIGFGIGAAAAAVGGWALAFR